MLADHLEDRPFQDERVVNGHEADIFYAIPARLATTGDARVHNVIGNEKIGLQLESIVNGASYWQGGEADPFDRPAEHGGLEVFHLSELAALEDRDRVNNTQASVELSTGDVVVHALWGGETLAQRKEEGRTRR